MHGLYTHACNLERILRNATEIAAREIPGRDIGLDELRAQLLMREQTRDILRAIVVMTGDQNSLRLSLITELDRLAALIQVRIDERVASERKGRHGRPDQHASRR